MFNMVKFIVVGISFVEVKNDVIISWVVFVKCVNGKVLLKSEIL